MSADEFRFALPPSCGTLEWFGEYRSSILGQLRHAIFARGMHRFLQVAFSTSSLAIARRFEVAIEPRERPLVSFGKRELRDGLFRIAKTEHRECHVLLYERSHGGRSGVPRRKEDSVK